MEGERQRERERDRESNEPFASPWCTRPLHKVAPRDTSIHLLESPCTTCVQLKFEFVKKGWGRKEERAAALQIRESIHAEPELLLPSAQLHRLRNTFSSLAKTAPSALETHLCQHFEAKALGMLLELSKVLAD